MQLISHVKLIFNFWFLFLIKSWKFYWFRYLQQLLQLFYSMQVFYTISNWFIIIIVSIIVIIIIIPRVSYYFILKSHPTCIATVSLRYFQHQNHRTNNNNEKSSNSSYVPGSIIFAASLAHCTFYSILVIHL